MRILDNTPFEFVYKLFVVSNDEEFLTRGYQIYAFIIALSTILSWKSLITYGKFSSGSKCNLWILSSTTISARSTWMFGHILSWIIPVLVVLYTPAPYKYDFCSCVGLGMYVLHYFNRSMIYPFQIPQNAARVELWFLLGMAVASALNGFILAHYLMNLHTVQLTPSGVIGLFMFVFGIAINKYHDYLLTSLKKNSTGSGKSSYRIPVGGLFEYVSCANYFGEIVEWFGVYMLTKGTPQLLFAIFSSTFLITRALQTHAFYKERFGEKYPKERKAIIPFLI